MEAQRILNEYHASDVRVDSDMMAWMRSNHAGETGAIWIYRGARLAFWNSRIQQMAKEHAEHESQHLVVMEHLVPVSERSWLLIIWRISGFVLGLLPALCGYRAFCTTIEAVETFVEKHYREQIDHLSASGKNAGLLAVLQRCCDEEVEHQQDAASHRGDKLSWLSRFWYRIVGRGSNIAVRLAKAW